MDSVTHNWNKQSKWIGRPGGSPCNWQGKVVPTPFFRKEFALDKVPDCAEIVICGIGYYELYLNGRKVGDHVLDPVVSHYDKVVRYVRYDVKDYLKSGVNVIGVVLGNGWYNCHTPEVWHFDKAPWRAYPKFILEMNSEDGLMLFSNDSWKFRTGPIVFDGLRNGETYDARLELSGWLDADYDESGWVAAERVHPPGGELHEQIMPPCKVMQTIAAEKRWSVPAGTVFDVEQNMAGWARIYVRGERGATVTLRYSDRLDDGKCVAQSMIAKHVLVEHGQFQTDRYTLKGEGVEVWEPRFTYHGFQYVQVEIDGNAEIEKLEGRVVYTAFDKIGSFECSDEDVNKLQCCTEWSYIGNFVGIPTDCPHREKNGWTGDAQLAAETGLFNYDAASSYAQWIDALVETQRPSGQLPGIVPSTGWGFNWGSGPAWDSALLLIPWYIYVYTGDDAVIKKHYPAMKKYVDYCTYMAEGNIVKFGLGDWGHPGRVKNPDCLVDNALTDTSYYYADAVMLAKFAELTGRDADHKYYSELAMEIKQAFNRKFYRGDGVYGKGEMTAMGCALHQGLVDEPEKKAVVAALVKAVEDVDYRPEFGILGAKFIPRALAENGHIELAYKLLTHAESLWMHWLKLGATTFWENWHGESSHNHVMFGDISAWFYQYLAGITPDPERPGFTRLLLKPMPVRALDCVNVRYRLPAGEMSIQWHKLDGRFVVDIVSPVSFVLQMPDGSCHELKPGIHRKDCAQME